VSTATHEVDDTHDTWRLVAPTILVGPPHPFVLALDAEPPNVETETTVPSTSKAKPANPSRAGAVFRRLTFPSANDN